MDTRPPKPRVRGFESRRAHKKYRPRGESPLDRVMAFVDRSGGPEACWPFNGDKTRDGYGRINHGARLLLAHKVVLEHKLGRPLAKGEVSRHKKCRNRVCCNPAHLVPGTRADNSADMVADGTSCAGERHPAAKLSQDQVCEIRGRAAAGPLNFEAVGREYGVTGRTVSYIVKGERWAHVAVQP